MAIGGFNGQGGNLSLVQFEAYVKAGDIHYYIASAAVDSAEGAVDSPEGAVDSPEGPAASPAVPEGPAAAPARARSPVGSRRTTGPRPSAARPSTT